MLNRTTYHVIRKISLVLIPLLLLASSSSVFASLDDRASTVISQERSPLQNVAYGKSYTLETPYPLDKHFSLMEQKYADDGGRQLTDGVFGGLDYNDTAYVGRLRQAARIVTLDLGHGASIEQIKLSLLQDSGSGIYFPSYMDVSLSVNGQDWEQMERVTNQLPNTDKVKRKQVLTVSGKDTVAKYVKIVLPVEVFIFIDEIEVSGRNDMQGRVLVPSLVPEKPQLNYPAKGAPQVGGIHNEVLIFTGEWKYNPSDWISFTKEDFEPYVTYVTYGADHTERVQDFMFDGFVFLPYDSLNDGTGYMPSARKPTSKQHFELFLNRLFREDKELGALNEAVKEAKRALPEKPYEAKVVLTIPHPRPDQNDFGDVDGDGISENLNPEQVGEAEALRNRYKVMKWYIDETLARWEQRGYSDLKLVSFYWHNESIPSFLAGNDQELLKLTGEYIRSKGLTLQWIPFYFASGWDNWKEYGFDAAFMQPNYMFGADAQTDRLDTIAQAARSAGMGVEIELEDKILENEALRQRYYAYLSKGAEHGYMHSVGVYYQQVKTLMKAARSVDPIQREVYDRTYQYMKGIYKP
ncbi:DUF4855 domain-containing protein [Paenibacillus sp. 481]|uniref:DUF4855 domain-containing protein n=1 Tax=Paenibacillus sp. 481 TaxID=2835869 RepID=UPI001E40BE7A|nr:DUF4855 domain-containing protein [Paenibacillus sp. 481]UHA74945.1 DUF4855 domain-containing protein [Paenibacillus sp. 481]